MIFDKAHLKSLFEISHIRFQKLLHLSQHGSITALITILFGKIINYYTFNLNFNEHYVTILVKTILEIIFIIIAVYYINKIAKIIPFLFRYTKSYKPFRQSSDGENLMGIPITIAIVFSVALKKTQDKLEYLIFN